jgi:hypothetical protein
MSASSIQHAFGLINPNPRLGAGAAVLINPLKSLRNTKRASSDLHALTASDPK